MKTIIIDEINKHLEDAAIFVGTSDLCVQMHLEIARTLINEFKDKLTAEVSLKLVDDIRKRVKDTFE